MLLKVNIQALQRKQKPFKQATVGKHVLWKWATMRTSVANAATPNCKARSLIWEPWTFAFTATAATTTHP
eukprot:5472915-Amphidinium_carterae.1